MAPSIPFWLFCVKAVAAHGADGGDESGVDGAVYGVVAVSE